MEEHADEKAMDYREQVRREFDTLFCRAEEKNRLFYLFNLFNLWRVRGTRSSAFYTQHINEIISHLMFQRVMRGEHIPFHDMVLVLQLSMEAKGFYSTLRNFLHVVIGEYAEQEPWFRDELGGNAMSTARIIRNLVEEFRIANCQFLASEFHKTHEMDGLRIRNAIAHGNFAPPRRDTGGEWVFGNYSLRPWDWITIEETRYAPDEFNRICQGFFLFRMGFVDAFDHHLAKYRDMVFGFEAPNQSRPTEILRCEFDRGNLKITCQETPFFGMVGRVVFYLERNGYSVAVGKTRITATDNATGRSCTLVCDDENDLSRIAGELAQHVDIDIRSRVTAKTG